MNNYHLNPVLLIHGFLVDSRVFRKMSTYLTDLGWSVHSFNLVPNYGIVGIDELAEQIVDYVDQTFDPEQPFDLVGLSMGGLVSRYYIQRLGGIKRVQRFIAISSPHHGTWTAYTLGNKGCIQMRPKSDFLASLNQDVMILAQLNFTSIWTPWDFMIVPANSSQLPVGKEIKLPIFAHANMARHPLSLKAVAKALKEPIKISGDENHG